MVALEAVTSSKPRRLRREKVRALSDDVVDVGPGTKWQLPFKKKDIDTLVSSESDIAAAVREGGWKAGALILYRDFLREEQLDPTELQGKDLSCTCKLSEPCHADVLIELANA
jgi:Domain of unknown function (DUF4326)